ncbi:MAG TPA: nucleotidyltransferase domain-containing protein [Thermomicrobiaceae bacterium]|nr:nucleotidyltransferase domain-containing protein [Thermomicrobiaceae bacterium]
MSEPTIRWNGDPAVTASAIPSIVERIVERFDPLRIILFGSFARGEGGRDSDIDLLVVLPEVENKRQAAIEVLRSLSGRAVPLDVIVTDPDEISRRGDAIGTVLRPALREGRVLYERP